MTGLIRRSFSLAVGGVLLLAMPAMATSVTWQSTDGKAVFNIVQVTPTTGFIDVTLTNLFNPVDDISKELDGLSFTVGGGSGSAALSSNPADYSAPNGEVDCNMSTATPCPTAPLTAGPWGWVLGGTTNNLILDAGGIGTFHPLAIVNSSITGHGGNGGTSNPQHNPLLVGPVTFRIDISGTVPVSVSAVTFAFGTQPDLETGTCRDTCGTITTFTGGITPVPEPASLLLIGSGLVIGARRVRQNLKKRA